MNTKLTSLIAAGLIMAAGFASADDQVRIKTEEKDTEIQQIIDKVKLPVEYHPLVFAPNVPAPITRKKPAHVIIQFESNEHPMRLADGVEYTFWTFGGHVPGPFIRVREGDRITLALSNHPTSKMPHNIDLHAVTGPGGGAASTFTSPGHTSIFTWKALQKGLYIYHCAVAPVGMHIGNGMYGLVLVEPKEGLPKVDREYYIVQGEFYTKGKYGEPGLQPFDMEKALAENPPYVVFNGSVGALSGKNSINAKVGDKVRLFVGNAGPNLVSSFHVIGEIFDTVHVEGGTALNHNVQTTVIPAGGAAMIELTADVPGDYTIVDHSIFRAFNKGALGNLHVTGPENLEIYSNKQFDKVYLPEGSAVSSIKTEEAPKLFAKNKDDRIRFGKNTYESICLVCHQEDGTGIEGAYPPLKESDYFNEDPMRGVKAILFGLEGKITVNGNEYDMVMPAQDLSDEEIANVITYVLNNFGNKGGEVKPDQVKKIRDAGADKK